MNEEEKRQFFANKPGEPNTVHVGGRFSFNSLDKEIQVKIKKRLAEKDDVIAKGLKGILPGIKINGKQVTKDNIHEFEKKVKAPKVKKAKKIEKKKVIKKVEYTKEGLQKIADNKGLKGLRVIGSKLGIKFRGVKEAIREIMGAQK